VETGEVHNPEHKEKVDKTTKLPVSNHGKMRDSITPIVVLFAATILFIIWTGYQGAGADKSLMNIFGEAVIEDSLIYGGLIALLVTFILFFRHMKQGELTLSQFGQGIGEGIKSMLPAFFILIFAWSIAFLIEELQTGDYLGW